MSSSIVKWPLLVVSCDRLNEKQQVDEVAPPVNSALSRRWSTVARDLVGGATSYDRDN
jgi:hypothetical protein